MKRKLTPEQETAREARREKFRALVKRVAAMTDEERAGILPAIGAVPTCEGRTLTVKNTCLCIFQMPGVSLVGGFRQWLAQGRVVRKGQHGLMIWIPLGAAKGEDGAEGDVRFGTATVFDISQTEALEQEAGPRVEGEGVEFNVGGVLALTA